MTSNAQTAPDHVKGWILDAYPEGEGKIAVWIISENGKRIKLTDKFQSKIYVSTTQDELERLVSRLYNNQIIASWRFTYKYAQPTDNEKSRVLELTLKDCRKTGSLTRTILKLGDYLRYEIHNCDLRGDRDYFFSHDIFPLALVEITTGNAGLEYTLLDSVTSTDYAVPDLRVLKLEVEIAKKGKIANFQDPIDQIIVTQNTKKVTINSGEEKEKLLGLVKTVKELDPDFLVTHGGDSYLFPYLTQRATLNHILDDFILSRDDTPFKSKTPSGRTFFSYGRSFYRAGVIRLFGRIHISESSGFVLSEAGLEGLIEIARTCRVP
jgi:DNA polymerase elongation subunit (family B)